MKKFDSEDLDKFLIAIDGELSQPATIIMIGGTAAILAYKVSQATKDIDTWNKIEHLIQAYEEAKKKTGMDIPLQQSGAATGPENLEDRFENYKPTMFKQLRVQVPEVIDLILMKAVRAEAHDLEANDEMIKNGNITSAALIGRFTEEMYSTVGDKNRLVIGFVGMIQKSFPNEGHDDLEERIWENWKKRG